MSNCDVIVYRIADGERVSIVGRNLKKDAGKRLIACSWINGDYIAKIVPAGKYRTGDKYESFDDEII